MYKNVQANPEKSQKLTQHSYCSMLTLGKKFKSRRGNEYRFVQKGETFPTETITLVVRSSGLWEAYTPNLPQMGQNFYHGMLMPLHDSMPSFMNFGQILDLLELQKRVRRCLLETTVPWCSNFIPISCMGHKHKPMDTYMILQLMLVHRSMCI